MAPRSFHWVAAFLYVSVLLLNLYSWWDTWPLARWREAQLIGGFALLILLESFEGWRYAERAPWYMALALLAGRMVLIEFLVWASPKTFTTGLYVAVPFYAYFSFGERTSIGLGALLLALNAVRSWLVCMQWEAWTGCFDQNITGLLLLFVSTAFCISMARVISTEKTSRAHAEALLGELETSHKKLRAYAAQVAELAAAEERNRLARDIHDSLGHYLTAVNVQLEKALAFRERNPQEADQAIRDAKRTAKEALQDVRQSMGALRSTQEVFCLDAALTALVQTMRSGGLGIEFQIEGQEAGFSKAVLMTLFRAAQEGLTNIQKHAKAECAILQIHLHENAATLSLSDNGCGFDPGILNGVVADHRNCFGLRGLQERVELVGGSMKIESAPNQGTRLLITVPKDPLALDRAGTPSKERLA
jgi:signal transduction histidine kinase